MGVGPSVYSKTQGGHTQKDRAVPPASSALTGGAEQARGLAFAIYSTLLLVLSFLVMSTLVLKQGVNSTRAFAVVNRSGLVTPSLSSA